MNAITLNSLRALKAEDKKFACLTAYDASFSHLLSSNGIELLLVGDSLGMVIRGYHSTVPVVMEEMLYHTQCVAAGNQGALLMADLPFMSYATPAQALENSARLMRAGANIVKLEECQQLVEIIAALNGCGIPSCAHIGLAPQSVNKLGGYRVQGRDAATAQAMIEKAVALEEAGADLLLLECVPSRLAETITRQLTIPVIGIGAGATPDGQILVLHDMLGVTPGKPPKFVKNFMDEATTIKGAIIAYREAVRSGTFPGIEQSFS